MIAEQAAVWHVVTLDIHCWRSLLPPPSSGYIFFVNENWEHSLTFSLEEMAVLTAMSAKTRMSYSCERLIFQAFNPWRIFRYTDAFKLGSHNVIMMKLKNETYRQTGMNCHAHKSIEGTWGAWIKSKLWCWYKVWMLLWGRRSQ